MNVGESINTLQMINADMGKMPARLMDSFHNPETEDSIEKVFTDLLSDQNNFKANIKAIRTNITVEDILLNELRGK